MLSRSRSRSSRLSSRFLLPKRSAIISLLPILSVANVGRDVVWSAKTGWRISQYLHLAFRASIMEEVHVKMKEK
jgi:hypothetical protein